MRIISNPDVSICSFNHCLIAENTPVHLRLAHIVKHYGLDGLGSSPIGARFSAPVQTGLGSHPASCTVGTMFLSRGQSGQCVALTNHPDLALGLRKNRALPLLPLWAFMARSRVIFTFTHCEGCFVSQMAGFRTFRHLITKAYLILIHIPSVCVLTASSDSTSVCLRCYINSDLLTVNCVLAHEWQISPNFLLVNFPESLNFLFYIFLCLIFFIAYVFVSS
jgi:hypothetical protein